MKSANIGPPAPVLAYTVAFDSPDSGGCRQMARMLGASIARTYFGGDLLIVLNSPAPLFLVQREGVTEEFVEPGQIFGDNKPNAIALAELAMEWKALAAKEVIGERVAHYSWVLFLDVDCLVLRNLDHLFDLDDEDETAKTNKRPVL